MFGSGKIFRKQKAGKPVSARAINATKLTVEGYTRFAVAAPLAMEMAGSIPCLRLSGRLITIFKTGTGGIPARVGSTPGKADVTLINFDGDNLTTADTQPLYNINGAAPIGPNKYGIAVNIGPYWLAVMAEC